MNDWSFVAIKTDKLGNKEKEAGLMTMQSISNQSAIIEQSLAKNRFEYLSAAEAQSELEVFYQSLMQVNPKLLGGKLPNAEFYVEGP